MSDREALMRHILDNPEDMTARLVFADWLEEHNEADRARVIRLEIEADALGEDSPRYDSLNDEAGTIRGAHPEWTAKFDRFAEFTCTRRGFVEQLELETVHFLDNAENIFSDSPIVDVFFMGVRGYATRLAKCQWISRLREVGFGPHELTNATARTLFGSPYWSNVQSIDVSENDIETMGAKAIFGNPAFANLREVSMWYCNVRAMAMRTLAESREFTKIEKINLGSNVLDDRGIRFLCSAPHLQSVSELTLYGNEITDIGMRSLAECEYFTNLRNLNLHSNEYSDRGAAALVMSPIVSRLESLYLHGTHLTGSVFDSIRRTPQLQRLKQFSINFSGTTTSTGLDSMVVADPLPALEQMALRGGRMGPTAWLALGRWKRLSQLTSLRLRESNCTQEHGVAGLLRHPLPMMRELDLARNDLTAEAIKTLAQSPHLPALESLDLAENHVGEVGARALLESPYLQKLNSLDLQNTSVPKPLQSALKERFGARNCQF